MMESDGAVSPNLCRGTAAILGAICGPLAWIGVAAIDSRVAAILGSLSYSCRVLQSARENEKKCPWGWPEGESVL